MSDGPQTVDHVSRLSSPGDPIRVLLCDDVESYRALLRASLDQDPRIEIVGEAADGHQGIEAATALQPDVVLLDMHMPRLGGLEAIPQLRRRAPRTSIIGLSSDPASAASSLEVGATDYLEKSCEIDELRAAIHAAVDRA
jgi:DNA-binding NarL/FixJ family response regulator